MSLCSIQASGHKKKKQSTCFWSLPWANNLHGKTQDKQSTWHRLSLCKKYTINLVTVWCGVALCSICILSTAKCRWDNIFMTWTRQKINRVPASTTSWLVATACCWKNQLGGFCMTWHFAVFMLQSIRKIKQSTYAFSTTAKSLPSKEEREKINMAVGNHCKKKYIINLMTAWYGMTWHYVVSACFEVIIIWDIFCDART